MIPVIDATRAARTPPALNPRVKDDPRLSKAQRDALLRYAEKDGDAVVLGLDTKMRPVVRARLSGPGSMVEVALLRNGEPTSKVGKLAEVWR